MTPRIGPEFVAWRRPDGSDRALGVVDFSIFPHLDVFPTKTLAKAREWAARIDGPSYILDDQSAIVVDGDRVEVMSEGSGTTSLPAEGTRAGAGMGTVKGLTPPRPEEPRGCWL